jgi:hypothetical protein
MLSCKGLLAAKSSQPQTAEGMQVAARRQLRVTVWLLEWRLTEEMFRLIGKNSARVGE